MPKLPPLTTLILLIILQVVDFATTYTAVSKGASEVNPLVKALLPYPWLLLALKLTIAALACFFSSKHKTIYYVTIILYVQAIIMNILNTVA